MTGGICNSFKRDLFLGLHQPGDEYRLALFVGTSSLCAATETYSAAGEASGQGYESGGRRVSLVAGKDACLNIAKFPTWDNSTITARGALVYNASKGNRAVVVLDFGRDYSSMNGPFTIHPPEGDLICIL